MFEPYERRLIQRFAVGDPGTRELAIDIFRRELAAHGVNMRGDPFFEFMSETDSKCPDYSLRGMYRKIVIDTKLDLRPERVR
jgi:hypothetical protein